MKSVLIVQNVIFSYRPPLFNELAKKYEVTVLHSGQPVKQTSDAFNEVVTKTYQVGPFFLQQGIFPLLSKSKYDVIILMCDLRWPSSIIPFLFHSHSRLLLWGNRYGNNQLINWVRNFCMRQADGVILYDESDIEKMVDSGIKRENIFIAPNTIDVPNFQDTSQMPKCSFLYVGRAQRRKRVDLLLKSFSEVHTQLPPNIVIDIVGEGDENVELKNLARQLGVAERVFFHGEVTDIERLKSFFARAIAYVSPRAVGLAVLHSFAYGVPVVTSSQDKHGPEFSNLIHGSNAMIFDEDKDLASYLVTLVKDTAMRNDLGHQAFIHYSTNRSLKNMVDGFIEAIES